MPIMTGWPRQAGEKCNKFLPALTFRHPAGYNEPMTNATRMTFPSRFGNRDCPDNFRVTWTDGRCVTVAIRDRGWYNVTDTFRGDTRQLIMNYCEAVRFYDDVMAQRGEGVGGMITFKAK